MFRALHAAGCGGCIHGYMAGEGSGNMLNNRSNPLNNCSKKVKRIFGAGLKHDAMSWDGLAKTAH